MADSLNLNWFHIMKLAEKPKLNRFSGLTEVAQNGMLLMGGRIAEVGTNPWRWDCLEQAQAGFVLTLSDGE